MAISTTTRIECQYSLLKSRSAVLTIPRLWFGKDFWFSSSDFLLCLVQPFRKNHIIANGMYCSELMFCTDGCTHSFWNQTKTRKQETEPCTLPSVRTHSNAWIFLFLRIKNRVAFGIFAGNGNQENHAIN